ncbi:MAG TPA: tetratricopeptide repeat protein, partial [Anaerolineae bacterium]|nr:tetratricopeptide repeat protein [Anaerolineae bacterium]
PKDSEEGEKWLRQAAEANEPQAMRILGTRLLDGDGLVKDSEEGEKWLLQAVKSGDVRAMETLGDLLIEGKNLSKAVTEGLRLLRKAADAGYTPATANLGYRYLNGEGLPQNKARGREYLAKIENSTNAQEMAFIGDKRHEVGDYTSAIEFYLRSFELGNEDARNNLAYMLRRSEVPLGTVLPNTAIELLLTLVEKDYSFGIVNYALCLASGFQCSEDWKAADQLMARIRKVSGVFDWWYDLVKKDDPEGDLVVGWLARHGLISDPDGLTVAERMRRARIGGWKVPEWMDEVVKPSAT